MAGHNKWSKVKNVKGALDVKKGKMFTKLNKEIIVSARIGGGSPDSNARLRNAILAAREASMPKENIERAIKKGTGELESETIEEATYEGYAPGGVAVLVETTSDNKNRTVSELRNIFKSHGGHMGESGSVAWMFTHYGQLLFDAKKTPEEKVMEIALDAGAQDIKSSDDTVEVLTGTTDLFAVRDAFEKSGVTPTATGFSYVAKSTVPISNKEVGKQLLELFEAIEDHDDVQRLHSNFDMDDKLLAELSGK